MMRRVLSFVLSLGLAAASLVIASPAVSLADPSSILSGPNVIRYAPTTTTSFILNGISVAAGGCSFTLKGSQGPDGVLTAQQELAYDPSTCRAEIGPAVDATPPGGSADQSVAGGGEGQQLSEPGASPDYGGGARCTNPYADNHYYPYEACIHSWFADPPGFHVNDLTNEVQWTPAGGCASSGRTYASWYAQWLVATGWYLAGNTFAPSYLCAGVTSKSVTAYANTAFCSGFLTTTTYNPQLVEGFASGAYTWSVSWTKSGVCSFLLGFHTENS
jgi:hypothetical protein